MLPLLFTLLLAADPVPFPASPSIRLPEIAVIPPAPVPFAPTTITPNAVYVFDADVAVDVAIYPPNPKAFVKITPATGPMTIRDVFIGGTGKKEIRKFNGKFVYILESGEQPGLCTLVITPIGFTDATAKIVRLLDNAIEPIPPPPPPPDSDPLLVALRPLYKPADAANVGRLASVYEKAAMATVDDKSLMTLGDMQGTLKDAAAAVVPLPLLQTIRERIATELKTTLGTEPGTILTPDVRARCKAQYERMGRILRTLGAP